MTLIVDTGPLVASADVRDRMRILSQAVFRGTREELIVPAPVTQEVDYLLRTRIGPEAQTAFCRDILEGTFRVECLATAEYQHVFELAERYAALRPGLADLSIVVLALRFETRRIVTLDQRHFRAMRPLQGGEFTLLPWDGP